MKITRIKGGFWSQQPDIIIKEDNGYTYIGNMSFKREDLKAITTSPQIIHGIVPMSLTRVSFLGTGVELGFIAIRAKSTNKILPEIRKHFNL
jgi:hypothetical protein